MADHQTQASASSGIRPALGEGAVPVRLQLSRRKGFDLQAISLATNGLPAVNCARPGILGNPWTIRGAREVGYTGTDAQLAAWACTLYREWVEGDPRSLTRMLGGGEARVARLRVRLPDLRSRNLACWCGLCPAHTTTGKPFTVACPACAPCHADALGRIACTDPTSTPEA